MTDNEMLHYLDLYSDDPLIRRLIDVLQNTRGALINELENAGMDPKTWQFKTDYQWMYPGDYIIQLRRDLEDAEDQLKDLQYQHEELHDKYDQLKTRNIMKFIEEVQQEKRAAGHKVQEALKEAEKQRRENEKLREQIDMWGKLNQVKHTA
jgi:DNA repair exonuclease SbcCD ATPase subunit